MTIKDHPLSANCLRKCGFWKVFIFDIKNKKVAGEINNSGVALRQMNYEIKDEHRQLTKEEIRERKLKIPIPQGAESFRRDIIDDFIEWENNAIISFNE